MPLVAMLLTFSLTSPLARQPILRAPSPVRAEQPCAQEISVDVEFYRKAKMALRAALHADAGMLSEDALAMISALSAVNPTRPDPSADEDLWSGHFELASSMIAALNSPVVQAGAAVDIGDDGAVTLAATLRAREEMAQDVKVNLQAHLHAISDAELELNCHELLLHAESDTAAVRSVVEACSTAAGVALQRADEGDGCRWEASAKLASLRLAILYLDQDLHVARWRTADDKAAEPVIDALGELNVEELVAGGKLVILNKQAT